MDKKTILIILLVVILIGLLFIDRKPETVVKIETRENTEKIDSLKSVIRRDSVLVDSLKKETGKIREKVIVKIEKIKTLPPDSTIKVFHDYTETYGELGSEEPTLTQDSSIICSADNLRDANIIAAKLEGELEKEKNYQEIIKTDSMMLFRKDLIILEDSVILKKTETAYEQCIASLSADLRKERKKKRVTAVIGGIAVLVLGTLVVTK